jgi:hypothetical protein
MRTEHCFFALHSLSCPWQFAYPDDEAIGRRYGALLWILKALHVLAAAPGSCPELPEIVSLEAIFLSTFVLISQNRAGSIADKRADLDLQINLLSEHEITHLLTMIDAIAAHLGIDAKKGMEIEDLKKDVGAEQVLREIESREKIEQEKQ